MLVAVVGGCRRLLSHEGGGRIQGVFMKLNWLWISERVVFHSFYFCFKIFDHH